jgi:hypothetical protein
MTQFADIPDKTGPPDPATYGWDSSPFSLLQDPSAPNAPSATKYPRPSASHPRHLWTCFAWFH